jgi:hypothetical protein
MKIFANGDLLISRTELRELHILAQPNWQVKNNAFCIPKGEWEMIRTIRKRMRLDNGKKYSGGK